MIAAVGFSLSGCGSGDKIESYQVDKPDTLVRTYFHDNDRMLAVILPHGSNFWFFKFAGPDDAVTKQTKEFLRFLYSVQFADADSPPQWSLPDGWQQKPGNEMRYATIQVDPGPPALEISVTKLDKPPLPAATAVKILDNVNRWRGLMGLSPITAGEIADHTKQLKIGDDTATLVNLVGKLQSGGMGSAPFAGGALPAGHPDIPFDSSAPGSQPDSNSLPPGHPAIPESASDSSSQPEVPDASPGVTYETPSGWQPGKMSAMRKAAFVVQDGSQSAEITVVVLPPFAADVLANVNRWRGQLHLPDIEAKDLDSAVKPISIGGAKGTFVDITGPSDPAPQRSILGAFAPAGGQVWFFKLEGDTKLAEREKPKFESFVKSVKFQ